MRKVVIKIILILLVFIPVGCSKHNDIPNVNSENININENNYTKNDVGIVSDIILANKTLPENISLSVYWSFYDELNNVDLNELEIYEFEAIIQADGNFYKRKFTGINLQEFIKFLKLPTSVQKFLFESYYGVKKGYDIHHITDSFWLIFEIDDKITEPINKWRYFTLMNVYMDSNEWVYDVHRLGAARPEDV